MRKYTLITFLIISSFCAKSQVVYNYVGSLYPLSGYQEIDIDNNGQTDFRIVLSSNQITFQGLNGTLFETDGNQTLLGFVYGVQLGQQTYESSGEIQNNSSQFPFTIPATSRFIGLKFKINGTYHCAYLRVSKDSSGGNTFFHYEASGYDLNPQNCIITGDKGELGVDELSQESNINVFPNPFYNTFFVDFKNETNYTSYKLMNSYGKMVQSSPILDHSSLEITVDLAKGVYFLILDSAVNNTTIKLMKL